MPLKISEFELFQSDQGFKSQNQIFSNAAVLSYNIVFSNQKYNIPKIWNDPNWSLVLYMGRNPDGVTCPDLH